MTHLLMWMSQMSIQMTGFVDVDEREAITDDSFVDIDEPHVNIDDWFVKGGGTIQNEFHFHSLIGTQNVWFILSVKKNGLSLFFSNSELIFTVYFYLFLTTFLPILIKETMKFYVRKISFSCYFYCNIFNNLTIIDFMKKMT